MMKNLEPLVAEFEGEFAVKEGWTIVYETDVSTGEFIGAKYEYVPLHSSVMAGSYLDKPIVEQGLATIRHGDTWKLVEDHRGKSAWHKDTGEKVTVTGLGSLDPCLTFLEPLEESVWDGSRWVPDLNKLEIKKNAEVSEKMRTALDKITNLKAGILLGDDLDEELEIWLKYLQDLRSVVVSEKGFTLPKEPA